MRVPLAVLAVLLWSGGAALAQSPDLSGTWVLNEALSQKLAEKVKAAAGSESMSGSAGFAAGVDTWIPWSGGFSEPQRMELRDFLLASAPALQNLEIVQSGDEVKTIHGEDGVRLFNLKRATSGTSAGSAETVTRTARWQETQLVLESKGKESRFLEVLTPVPTRKQLTYALRLEHKLLKEPLEVSLVYDRSATP
jgi:hypothetical protein